MIYNFDNNNYAEKMKYNRTKGAKNNIYKYFNEKKTLMMVGDSDDDGHWSPHTILTAGPMGRMRVAGAFAPDAKTTMVAGEIVIITGLFVM